MNRRDLLAASAAAAAMTGAAFAQTSHDHGSSDSALAGAAAACVRSGLACLDHCLQNFGDASLAACARAVDQMVPVSALLLKLAAEKSAHLVPMARVALAVCQDCERECRKHADQHAVCKTCADTCANALAECKKVIG